MNADEDANTGRAHRRAFLAAAGAALAAGATSTRAGISHFGGDVVSSDQYFVGLVDNAALPGVSGELMLNVYLSIRNGGTGIGLLSDPLHGAVNSHLAVQSATRDGSRFRIDGVIVRSNTPAWIGQAFSVTAEVRNEFTTLALTLNGDTFSGQGARAGFTDPIGTL